jgi:hypothetical protein
MNKIIRLSLNYHFIHFIYNLISIYLNQEIKKTKQKLNSELKLKYWKHALNYIIIYKDKYYDFFFQKIVFEKEHLCSFGEKF